MTTSMASLHMNTTALPLSMRTSSYGGSCASVSAETSPVDTSAPSKQTRQIVSLVQCSQCSYPLREPVTLPCGNSLCKRCIPESHLRSNISYPATENRLRGFTCPFAGCRREHVAGDYSVDVVLRKIMETVRRDIDTHENLPEASREVLQLEEKYKWSTAGLSSMQDDATTAQSPAHAVNVDKIALAHNVPSDYTAVSPTVEALEYLDAAVLASLKEAARSELDCQVCYGLFLDPLTTACGHTLCRTCLHRVQDHSNTCPICRRLVDLPPGVTSLQAPSNALINRLLTSLCPAALAARIETARLEEAGPAGLDTPIFICTLSVPHTPTFLHIFEPRYRLMMRRAVESGERKFGMVLGNPRQQVQGDLGAVPFYQYGTMLHITNMQIMPDGRSIIESIGTTRFRIQKYGHLDGYMVAKIEAVHDVSLSEEEAIEAAETSSSEDKTRHFSAQDHFGTRLHRIPPQARPPILEMGNLTSLSTIQLMEIVTGFVKRMREMSAPWLHRHVVQSYGECPEDPALFPWWFACVIPTSDAEKYKLLETTTVRQRLKMCVVFAAELERQRWYDYLCSSFLLQYVEHQT